MRHAYLIIAHSNWWQLKQLLMLLDDAHNGIYVHIDKKSTDFKQSDFEGITSKSSVRFFQKYEVYWGGYSQIQVELYLGEQAHSVGYDYYHYISGMDLPLKSNEEIQRFFETNNGYEFIEYDDNKLMNDPEIDRRTRLYHFLQNYRRRYKKKIYNDFFTLLERILLVMQILIGINRVRNLDWIIKYGSNWVSITDSLMETVLKNKEKIYTVFHCTNCSDELFIQTIAYNCGYKDKIYRPKEPKLAPNLRFIDWKRGKNGNPYVFKFEDLALLEQRHELFARKFSETVDKKVIEALIEKREETNSG